MKKHIFICMLLFLCACSADANPTDASAVPIETPEPSMTVSVTEIPTVVLTEPVMEPPNPFPMESGSYLETYTDEDTQYYLDYYLFIPEYASDDMPLIVFLHGDGEIGKPEILENFGLIKSAREIYGDDFPFIAISPCTRIKSWISGSIPQTLMGLIDEISTRLSINTDRIIITGHSRGAIGVWYMISTYGDSFAAAVPISCGAETALNMDNFLQVPVRAYAGDTGKSERMYQNAMLQIVERIKENGGNAELIVLENRDHGQMSESVFSEELFQWMLEQ